MSTPIYSSYPGIWHVQHSSRELWHGKRNVHAEFTAEGSLDYTYQERETSEIKAYKDTDWKVVVDGKDGYLQCWMKETEYGIEDSAGEIRGDWRARWVVVAFPSGSNTIDGVDILCNRQTEIGRDTRIEILGILKLKSKNAQFPGLNDLVLLAVPDDGARNEEMRKAAEQVQRQWEKRTGKEVGISEDLIYDDVEEEEEASRCGVQ